MKMIRDDDDKEDGRYYLCYKYGVDFKQVSLYKWDGIFTKMHSTVYTLNWLDKVLVSHDIKFSPSCRGIVTFELDDEEEYKHIEMELITTNL